ncbi:EamA family transporter [Candidatus Gottesmanbacteria bacterium]|nr:EamA family transporter [Candidatus Gottesmanbacteria bacterium]
MNKKVIEGPFTVMLAASLWAVDALIRTPLTKTIPSASIVFYEHAIGLFVFSPLFIKSMTILRTLSTKTWMHVALLALVSSVGGTILFTQALSVSFATGDFITPLLLQKLQPFLVIVLARIILKEKLHIQFFIWAPIALIGSHLMSFGNLLPHVSLANKELVVLLSLGAAACWGSGTIISKLLLSKYSPRDATFLRFLAAIPLSFVIAITLGQYAPPSVLSTTDLIRFVAISLTTGAAALLLYYQGLSHTRAHIATIAELSFPLVSVIIGITALNPYGAPQSLSAYQIAGIILLIASVLRISFLQQSSSPPVRVVGEVMRGTADGKKLGFPTANIKLSKSLDLVHGVYACEVTIDGKTYQGVLHYGPRLVFGESEPQFEVNIFSFNKKIYGKKVEVTVKDFIRPTRQFSSKQALIREMRKDAVVAKKILQAI